MAEQMLPNCIVCSKQIGYRSYISSGGRRKTCSRSCAVRLRTIKAEGRKRRDCPQCGCSFIAKTEKTVFCSMSCFRINCKAPPNKCGWCAVQFTPMRYSASKSKLVCDGGDTRGYCSDKCRMSGAYHKYQKRCAYCDVLFTPIRLSGTGINKLEPYCLATTCSKECRSKAYPATIEMRKAVSARMSKGNHPNWQGGSHRRGFRGHDWHKISEAARVRAGRVCECCGKTEAENGRRLDVNHKTPFHQHRNKEAANKPSNLEALCRSCHQKTDWRWRKDNPVQFIMAME